MARVVWGVISDEHGLRRGPRVDGRNPAPVEVGSLSHYLQGFIHPRCRISSINSMFPKEKRCGSKRPMKEPYRTWFLFQASRSTGAGHADIECKLGVSTSAGHEVFMAAFSSGPFKRFQH